MCGSALPPFSPSRGLRRPRLRMPLPTCSRPARLRRRQRRARSRCRGMPAATGAGHVGRTLGLSLRGRSQMLVSGRGGRSSGEQASAFSCRAAPRHGARAGRGRATPAEVGRGCARGGGEVRAGNNARAGFVGAEAHAGSHHSRAPGRCRSPSPAGAARAPRRSARARCCGTAPGGCRAASRRSAGRERGGCPAGCGKADRRARRDHAAR